MKILMVCLGNICRSPLAQGILEAKIAERGLDWTVDSAGTSSWHVDERPDSRSIDVARKHSIDITKQRGRKFYAYDLEEFDLIYAMDSSNYSNILALTANEDERKKVELILNELWPGKNMAVPDPYYDDDGFEKVYQMLDAACEAILNKYA